MPTYSRLSRSRLRGCHPDLEAIFHEAIKEVDITILCGHRGREAQEEAYRTGNSTLRWPLSKHNARPSLAVDWAPWFGREVRIDWKDTAAFARVAGYLERIAWEKGVELRWGGDWNSNHRTRDERFIDLGHVELVGE